MQPSLNAPFPWQLTQWNYLLDRIKNNCLPHALLLSGAEGLGKRLFATALAKILLCNQTSVIGQICNICRPCQLLSAGSYPDLYTLEPEEEGKVIRVDQIREFIEQMNQTSHQNNYRIALITPADAMQTAAANALLKTLEEPGPRSIIILISARPGFVPATIRSRCQILNFNPPSQHIAVEWLKAYRQTEQDGLLLTKLAENAPLRAIALADSVQLEQRQKFIQGLASISNQTAHPVQVAEMWLKFPTAEIIKWLSNLVIDLARIKAGLSLTTIINSDHGDFLQQVARSVKQTQLFEYLEQLYAAQKKINISNPNQQLLLEDLFYSWSLLCKTK